MARVIAETNIDLSIEKKALDGMHQAVSAVGEMQDRMDSGEFKGEDAALLIINSSRGTVFKNSDVSTVLTIVIYYGGEQITNINQLHEHFGSSAYIQWKWQRLDEENFGIISASDPRMANNGFMFTLSADDVDTKVDFLCELITM